MLGLGELKKQKEEQKQKRNNGEGSSTSTTHTPQENKKEVAIRNNFYKTNAPQLPHTNSSVHKQQYRSAPVHRKKKLSVPMIHHSGLIDEETTEDSSSDKEDEGCSSSYKDSTTQVINGNTPTIRKADIFKKLLEDTIEQYKKQEHSSDLARHLVKKQSPMQHWLSASKDMWIIENFFTDLHKKHRLNTEQLNFCSYLCACYLAKQHFKIDNLPYYTQEKSEASNEEKTIYSSKIISYLAKLISCGIVAADTRKSKSVLHYYTYDPTQNSLTKRHNTVIETYDSLYKFITNLHTILCTIKKPGGYGASIPEISIPKEICIFHNLDTLYVYCLAIPQAINQLINLKKLYISRCPNLCEISNYIANFTNLTYLDLQQNPLQINHIDFVPLTNLQVLTLNSNNIGDLPPSLTTLVNLQKLQLAFNALSNLPDCLSRLSTLTALNLSHNRFTNIPLAINTLTQLRYLNLSSNKDTSNKIKKINNLSSLCNLVTLNLYNNQIKTIPSFMRILTALIHLDLSKNEFSAFPDPEKLPIQLKQLDANDNKISKIPETINSLSQLTVLNLENNNIDGLPLAITYLTALHNLNLTNNTIRMVPVLTTSLTNLTRLQALVPTHKNGEATEVITCSIGTLGQSHPYLFDNLCFLDRF